MSERQTRVMNHWPKAIERTVPDTTAASDAVVIGNQNVLSAHDQRDHDQRSAIIGAEEEKERDEMRE